MADRPEKLFAGVLHDKAFDPCGPARRSALVRIVSLLGSATEIVCALGLDEYLVGISHECDHPARVLDRPRLSRPRFDAKGMTSEEIDAAVRRCMRDHGSVYTIDLDRLDSLSPTLLISQAVCEVCAVPTGSVRDAAGSLRHPPELLSLDAHSLDEIFGTILDVGRATDRSAVARELLDSMRARIHRVRTAVADQPRPSVLLLEWLDPPFAPGHWVPEMIEAAGGHNLVGTAGSRSDEIDPADLIGIDPDVLLIEPCGFGILEGMADADRHSDLLHAVAPRAIAEGRAWVLDSALFSRSGPRVVDGIELLAPLFHPSRFPGLPPPQPWLKS